MPVNDVHADRDRAESFGSMAEMYDRHRPSYPDDLIRDLVALEPAAVLDVGCGTGKAAVALIEHGVSVLGLEPDPRMAEVSRRHGVPVEVAAFESWQDAGRRFDLITCAQAWHWIDPEQGLRRTTELLRPGGTLARFWNYHVLDKQVVEAFDAVYRQHAPDADGLGHDPSASQDHDPFAGREGFVWTETRTYPWERELTADAWVALVATYSDHQRLGRERLASLQGALHETITRLGGTVRAHGGAYVRLARRA